MDPIKVTGVTEWPTPGTKHEVQSFLRFTNFYRHFIQDFSDHARALFDPTKKGVYWKWRPLEQEAFDKLEELITIILVLAFPDNSQMYHVEADALDVATRATISQQSLEDGMWDPIAFFSKSLSLVEQNYEIHDKEMLAIICALEEWWHFLEGAQHKFEIWTDHKNLEYFQTSKKLNRHQARWSLYLSRFDLTLHHQPGKSMGKIDALSWRSDHASGAGDNDNLMLLPLKLFEIRALEGLTAVEEKWNLLRDLRKAFRDGDKEESIVKAVEELQMGNSKSVQSAEWSELDGLLYFHGKVYIPPDLELQRRIVF